MSDKRQRLLAYAPLLARCSPESTIYGKCVAAKAERIQQNECAKEFDSLIKCFRKQVKRQKRARRIMTFFHFNYHYNEPYKVLLDGTFCQAALQTKINLREQMPKYMDAPVELFTTNCVMEELKRLGKEVHGALKICEQFDVAKCPHTPVRTAAACVEHMGRRSRKPVHEKFVIASQDEQLLFNLRDFGGIPLMSIKFNAILLEKPSKASENLEEQKSAELKAVEQLKQQLLGDEEATGKKKKKKVKGPNPLSCKKKKRLNEPLVKPEQTAAEKQKPARRRRKKKKAANPSA